MTSEKRRGRPTKAPKEGDRVSLGLRVTAQLKRQLDEAAAASGRSQSQEAEMRIARSFDRQDLLTDVLTLKFGDTLASLLLSYGDEEKLRRLALVGLQRTFGQFDYETYVKFNEAMGLTPRSLEEWKQTPEPPTDEEFEEMKRLHGIK